MSEGGGYSSTRLSIRISIRISISISIRISIREGTHLLD